jgi:hypothetical protein
MLRRLRDVLLVNVAIVNVHHLLVLGARYLNARHRDD